MWKLTTPLHRGAASSCNPGARTTPRTGLQTDSRIAVTASGQILDLAPGLLLKSQPRGWKLNCKRTGLGVVLLGLLIESAQATLIDRGGGLIYDSTLNITWQQDANLAETHSFGVQGIYSDGEMSWSTALAWISAMNASNYLGYHDWRLPTVTDKGTAGCNFSYSGTDCGWNVDTSGSEFAHLWYVDFQNLAHWPPSGPERQSYGLIDDPSNLADESLFFNIQTFDYWAATANASWPGSYVWYFAFGDGSQGAMGQNPGNSVWFFAWAVRDGNSSPQYFPPVISEPSSLVLMLAGFGLISSLRRRYRTYSKRETQNHTKLKESPHLTNGTLLF